MIRKDISTRRITGALLIILICLVCLLVIKAAFPGLWRPVRQVFAQGSDFFTGKETKTVAQVTEELRPGLEPGLEKLFAEKGGKYPPQKLCFIVLKKEKILEVWFLDNLNKWRHIKNYPITAGSGRLGPKLKERDRQVPEGIYRIIDLNPNSQFHLSMKINYPNDFDTRMARQDKRKKLGNDIFIHGNSVSIGCVAIGDRAIEEVFLLTHDTGYRNVRVIMAPYDLRRLPYPLTAQGGEYKWIEKPNWLPVLYNDIRQALMEFQHN